ncbi:hypothetical protein TNCV_3185221 [Trichonephila clavipes]|nr:hypothetical protein TNCV_3185221 [Trichonephila clavipes]
MSQSRGIVPPPPSQNPSLCHGWNQSIINMKCFCRCSPDEHMSCGPNVNEDLLDQMTCSHRICVQFRGSRHNCSLFKAFHAETNLLE